MKVHLKSSWNGIYWFLDRDEWNSYYDETVEVDEETFERWKQTFTNYWETQGEITKLAEESWEREERENTPNT